MWIYERQDWPELFWDDGTLAPMLAHIRYRQGLLLGRMMELGFEFKSEASLETLTSDIVKSSAIENEVLNPEEVRSSIARHLNIEVAGLVPTNREVDGIVEMTLDATQNFSADLTKERLCGWHAALFPTGFSGIYPITVGQWRSPNVDPMQVISGPFGREKVHYQAPNAAQLNHEMSLFLNWFSDTHVDPILKAGISHLWFVTIHPFEDGNGRIARAIADMALASADNLPDRFYSLSTQIAIERKDYYDNLERQQRGTTDITQWLEWFLSCLERALLKAENTLTHILFKARLWDVLNREQINDRQRLIINRMLEQNFEGYMNSSKYAKLAKCSTDTALRDIQCLRDLGILIQNPSRGRSTSYRLIDKLDR